jgi:uncharacterized protein (TIGR02594 family)
MLDAPPWMQIARREELFEGTRERAGSSDNPRIIQYLASVALGRCHDETYWCGAFVNWCLREAGMATMKEGASAAAWLRYGESLPLDQPRLGAIACVHHAPGRSTRGTTETGNHVAFFVASRGPGDLVLLGGNQGNCVQTKVYSGYWQIRGYRWPVLATGEPLPMSRR